ncbi:MAG TPA: TolC family protein [Sulfurospirillum arcachonense]|nr:TolC family protein [Sulfurospirillum arcachonense]
MEKIMRVLLWLTLFVIPIFASTTAYVELSLEKAIEILKSENLEVNVARFDEQIKEYEHELALADNYGKLDFVQTAMRSNDAGNVFGFKLESREASFGDFGFSEFDGTNPNILNVQPKDLNYPDARSHFQTKLQYQLPIYTGGKLEQYGKITKALQELSVIDTQKILSEKLYQLKKSYYDIYLLNTYIHNLNIINKNMDRLEMMAQSMINEGYAKRIDLLEVQSKKANVVRMTSKAEANKELVYHFISFLLNTKVKSVSGNEKEIELKEYSIDTILQNNLDIKKAKQGLSVTQMAIDLHKASNLPEIGAFAEYGSSDNTFLGDFTDHDAYTFGVQLRWNIFSGGASSNSIEKARVENLKVQKQVSLAQKGIILQVEKINTEIKSYNFDIESLKKEIELTRSIYKNYLGRYQEKLVSINDVIIKQSLEIEKVLKLNEVQNSRTSKILELDKIANGDSK